jgi:hypothetical protein
LCRSSDNLLYRDLAGKCRQNQTKAAHFHNVSTASAAARLLFTPDPGSTLFLVRPGERAGLGRFIQIKYVYQVRKEEMMTCIKL